MQPMLAQVLAQPAGHQHAYPVVHPAGVPQLAHAGIDDGHAGAAVAPGIQHRFVGRSPREIVEAWIEVVLGHTWVMVQHVVGKFAPAQLGQEAVAVGFGHRIAQRQHCRGGAAHRYFAEVQVRRQPRGAGFGGKIPRLRIAMQRAIAEALQRGAGTAFAGLEVLPETAIPRRPWRRQQRIQGFPRGQVEPGHRGQTRRRIPQVQWPPRGTGGFPERGEYPVRIALLGRQLPRFEQQRAVEAFRMQAGLAQAALDLRIALLDGRFVAARPQHRLGAGARRQCVQAGLGGAAQQQQARTAPFQLGSQRGQ